MQSIIYSSLLATAFAGYEQMASDFAELTTRYVKESGGDRAINQILSEEAFNNINEYGCWCYIGADHGRGHGAPVNHIDYKCQQLARGYDCAILDSNAANTSCVPWEVFYISGIGGGSAALAPTCEAFNADFCAQTACKIEGEFVLAVFNAALSGDGIDDTFSHANGFDDRAGCPLVNTCQDTYGFEVCQEQQCCGEYPARYPYRPLEGARGCCGQNTFDSAVMSCCDDGVARLSC
jgi:hypothetical protein